MDELGTPAAVEPTSETSYINPDGTWKEGWKEAYVPEDLREENFYSSDFCKDIPSLLKTAGNQAKMLGKRGVTPLSDKSSETEVAEWRKAHGIPDKYNYQKPEDVANNLDDEWINSNLEKLNKANLSQGQVNMVMDSIAELIRQKNKRYEEETQKVQSESWENILKDENTEFETNQAMIDKAVNQFTEGWSDEDKLALFPTLEKEKEMDLGDDYYKYIKPMRRKIWAKVGKLIGEHKTIQGEITGKNLQEQLKEVMNSPEFQTGVGKAHNDATAKAVELQKQIAASTGR